MERVVLGDMAFLGRLPDGQAKHHAVDILQVSIHVLLGAIEYGLCGITEGLVSSLAIESLPSVTGAVALYIGTATVNTADFAVLETVVLQELLDGIHAQYLGELSSFINHSLESFLIDNGKLLV